MPALTGRENAPRGVTADGSRVLFTTGHTQVGENALREATVDGDSSRILAVTPGGLAPNGQLALAGGDIYVAAGSAIVRTSAGGSDAVTVVGNRPAGVSDVVVAGDDLWWTTYQYGAPARIEVARMPRSGGPVEVLAVDVAGGLGRPYPEGSSALLASPIGVLRVQAGSPPEVVASAGVLGGAVTRMAVGQRAPLRHHRRGQAPAALRPAPRRRVLGAGRGRGHRGDIAVVGNQVVFFAARSGPSGHSELRSVAATGGQVRNVASGRYAHGDLAVVTGDRVVLSADDRVWIASVR